MQAADSEALRPRRAQSVVGHGQIETWESIYYGACIGRRQQLLARGGEGSGF